MPTPTMIERRTLLSSVGTGLFGLGAGTVLLTNSTGTATATATMGNLSMSGDQNTTSNGYTSDVSASVSGSWSYELPGGEPDRWVVTLRVSDGETWATVGETSQSNEYKQYSGGYSVSGSVTDTELFSAEFFAAPGPGKQITVDLPFEVWFRVLDTNDTPLASTAIQDTASVTVGQQEIDASLYGQVSGDGSVTIS